MSINEAKRFKGNQSVMVGTMGLATLLAGTMLTPAAASAQQAASTADTAQLEEIVVTAQRREQNIQDTPLAVSAFSAQALQASGVSNVKELSHVDPSLNIQHSAGVFLPFLRGIGNGAATSVGNEASVPVYIDDVYYTRLSSAYLAISSIERVEVLKGPQGTLFGRNSSGGAIQMFTKDPGKDPEVNATIGYANYDTISGNLYISTPLSDTLAWNISAGGSDQNDGWGKSITTGEDAYLEKFGTIRSKLVWEPTDSTKIKIVGFYAYSKGDIGFTQDRHKGTFGSSSQVPLGPGYPVPAIRLPSLADVGQFYNTRLNFLQYQREEGYGGSLRIDQGIGFADLVSITAFRRSKGHGHYDSDFSAQDIINYDLRNIDRQFTQELQLKSKSDSKIDWILGAYYLHSKQGYNPTGVYGDAVNAGVGVPGSVQNLYGIQTIDSYSLYGQATAPVTEATNLTLGLRYTSDKVKGVGFQTLDIPGVGTLPLPADFEQSKTFERLTWKGAIDHHFTDDVMVYASIARGYKSGTFNTLPLDSAPAKPEVVDTYEIGFKSELLDRRIRLNGALFWNGVKNPQVLTIINKGLTAAIGLTNADKARVKGGEIGFEAIAADGLKLRGAATYLDAKFLSFRNAPFYFPTQTPGAFNLEGPFTINDPVVDPRVPSDGANGNRLPRVPKWRFDLGFNYSLETGAGNLVTDVSVSYTDKFAWDADNRVIEKSVTLLNASLNFTPASLDWLTVSVWGKNLGKEKYYTISQPYVGPLGVGGDIAGAAAPRTYGGSVSVKF